MRTWVALLRNLILFCGIFGVANAVRSTGGERMVGLLAALVMLSVSGAITDYLAKEEW